MRRMFSMNKTNLFRFVSYLSLKNNVIRGVIFFQKLSKCI